MPYSFTAQEFLAYVVPGAVLVLGLMILFPAIRAIFGRGRIDIGGLGIFIIMSFVAGLMIQNVGYVIVEKPLERLGLVYRTNAIVPKNQTLLRQDLRQTLRATIQKQFTTDIDTLNLNDPKHFQEWRETVRNIYTQVLLERRSARLESYSQHYQLSINLSMSFLLLATLCGTIIAIRYRRQSWLWGIDVNFPNRWKKWPTIAGVLVCALIGLWRAYLFDDLFTRELVQAYLNNPLRWGHALNL